MAGISNNQSEPPILVVHCIDTEGPIGGNVRRRLDGSAEFMDNWLDIEATIREITSTTFRNDHQDSFGNPYVYNWFIMDFMGFSTNPKNRIQAYHDTYDHFKALPTQIDSFYWHYHHPPASGIGDQWSADWDSSQAYRDILLHRLIERHDWPEAYRAGGTIEDNKASHWLEETIMIDYSNRVLATAQPTTNIFDFNWFGAPSNWGFYHPDRQNLLQPGDMRRYIIRSVDLRSRFHELNEADVRQACQQAKQSGQPVILSYFSHDHRDMREETRHGLQVISTVTARENVPWRSCSAVEALQLSAGLQPLFINVSSERDGSAITLHTDQPIYQPKPWVGGESKTGQLQWLDVQAVSATEFSINLSEDIVRAVAAGASLSGNKFVYDIPI